MPISKVDFAGQTLIDLTNDTVSPGSLFAGETAHDKAGNAVAGSFDLTPEVSAQDAKIAAIKEALKGKGAGQGGGGATIQTCDVDVQASCAYTEVVDGKLQGEYNFFDFGVKKLACGSQVAIDHLGKFVGPWVSGGGTRDFKTATVPDVPTDGLKIVPA